MALQDTLSKAAQDLASYQQAAGVVTQDQAKLQADQGLADVANASAQISVKEAIGELTDALAAMPAVPALPAA